MSNKIPAVSSLGEKQLGAEATDTRIEALRLAEFAKFKPDYYLDQVNEIDLVEKRWRILATADIEGSEDAHFLNVIRSWTQEAEIVIPPVDRTEIVETVDSEESDGSITRTRRKLVPKRVEKDRVLVEDVIVDRLSNGLCARFVPCVQNVEDIPFYYPKVQEYALGYFKPDTGDDSTSRQLAIFVCELFPCSTTATKKQKLVWRDLIKRLFKWTVTERFGYQKRVENDVVICYEQYSAKYQELKTKYAAYWVENWPEKTDPKKFVYEDIGIASWIICLWEKEGKVSRDSPPPTFVDLGCGNGFLVYLLNKEGYLGYGVDQCSRKVWARFGSDIDLRAETVEPYMFEPNADWIIGNHADELVPWIPIISARATTNQTKFIAIPCCPHDLSGQKMAFPLTAGQSKYHAYVQYICGLAADCGFSIEKEFLRIPSTKNVAIVGRPGTGENGSGLRPDVAAKLALQGQKQFVPRVPDHVKNEIRLLKEQSRKGNSAEPS
ncbi:tRNA(Ser) Um(44) 2'-O-methyltransferase [Coemansia sp. Benny D160-2]|nr:tRNA(Ser) Um(44) 2'-O-methyltransferase [Coemansia sp. Benny D160-2]